MPRKKFAFKPSLIMLSVFILCITFGVQANAEKPKLRVVYTPYIGTSPIVLALENGYFGDEGLDIELVKMRRSSLAIPPLVQGKLDVVTGTNSFSLFNAIAQGANIKIVSSLTHQHDLGCAQGALIFRKGLDLELNNLDKAQLAGLRIATNPKSSLAFLLELFLMKYGLTLDDLNIVDIPYSMKEKALANRSVDLMTAYEPRLSRIVASGNGKVLTNMYHILPDYVDSTIFFGPTLLQDSPDLGIRFMRAFRKGVQDYLKGKIPANIAIMAKHTKLSYEVLKSACWSSVHPTGYIDPKGIEEFQKWALSKGRLDRMVPLEEYWEPKFLDQAKTKP